MSPPLVLGIDLGTTRIKAAAFEADGRQAASASESSPLRQLGPGRVEQDVAEVTRAADCAVCAVVEMLGPRASDLAAVGVCGQMGGITAVDAAGQPALPYDSPLDQRSQKYFERYVVSHLATILARAGSAPQWGHKLLFWREEQSAAWERVARFTSLAGSYAGELAGLKGDDAFMDRSYAAFSGLWAQGNDWDAELCALLGVAPEKLPRLVEPTAVVGSLRPERAAALGLPSGLPVVAGAGDGTCSLLGAGVVMPGMLGDLSGTASALSACCDRFAPDPEQQRIYSMPAAIPGLWYSSHVLFGGQAVRWFAEQFHPTNTGPDDLGARLRGWDARAAGLDANANESLFFLPHLGGRWYPPQPSARGGWLGLTWGTRAEQLYLAILESVSYEQALALERMQMLLPGWKPSEVRGLGGGARSALWGQLKADVLGVPYLPLKEIEFAARGVALLAGGAVGVVSDIRGAARLAETEAAIDPRPEALEMRRAGLRRYRALVTGAEELMSRVMTD